MTPIYCASCGALVGYITAGTYAPAVTCPSCEED